MQLVEVVVHPAVPDSSPDLVPSKTAYSVAVGDASHDKVTDVEPVVVSAVRLVGVDGGRTPLPRASRLERRTRPRCWPRPRSSTSYPQLGCSPCTLSPLRSKRGWGWSIRCPSWSVEHLIASGGRRGGPRQRDRSRPGCRVGGNRPASEAIVVPPEEPAPWGRWRYWRVAVAVDGHHCGRRTNGPERRLARLRDVTPVRVPLPVGSKASTVELGKLGVSTASTAKVPLGPLAVISLKSLGALHDGGLVGAGLPTVQKYTVSAHWGDGYSSAPPGRYVPRCDGAFARRSPPSVGWPGP